MIRVQVFNGFGSMSAKPLWTLFSDLFLFGVNPPDPLYRQWQTADVIDGFRVLSLPFAREGRPSRPCSLSSTLFVASQHLNRMIRSVSRESGGPVLAGLNQQLLQRGVKYFLSSRYLEM